jgi:hypothetical protein
LAGGQRGYSRAIAAIGAALVSLFVAAAAIGIAGGSIPTELWAAAGALSGALVGVLIPAPSVKHHPIVRASVIHQAAVSAAARRAKAVLDDDTVKEPDKKNARAAFDRVIESREGSRYAIRASTAARKAVERHVAKAAQPDAGAIEQAAAEAAVRAAADPNSATSQVSIFSTILDSGKVIVPAIVAGLAFYFGIQMSDGGIGYKSCVVHTPLTSGHTQAPCAAALFGAASTLLTLGAATAGALVGLFAPAPSKPN